MIPPSPTERERKDGGQDVQIHGSLPEPDVLSNAYLPGKQYDRGVRPVLRAPQDHVPLTRRIRLSFARELEKGTGFFVLPEDRK